LDRLGDLERKRNVFQRREGGGKKHQGRKTGKIAIRRGERAREGGRYQKKIGKDGTGEQKNNATQDWGEGIPGKGGEKT